MNPIQMIEPSYFKLIHFLGIFSLLLGLGTIIANAKALVNLPVGTRILAFAFHGLGLILILFSGLMLLGGIEKEDGALPWQIYAKLVIWLIFGLFITFSKRGKTSSAVLMSLALLLAGLAAYLGLTLYIL